MLPQSFTDMNLLKRISLLIILLLLVVLLLTSLVFRWFTWQVQESLIEQTQSDGVLITKLLAHSASFSEQVPQDVEKIIGEHMIAQATLAAYVVSVAEKAGLSTAEITSYLMDITRKTVLDELWITDSNGYAYLRTAPQIEFTFNPDPEKQPHGYLFWPLLVNEVESVAPEAWHRSLDEELFKYAAVGGVDQARIVQVGSKMMFLQELHAEVGLNRLIEHFLQSERVEAIWIVNRDTEVLSVGIDKGLPISQDIKTTDYEYLQTVIQDGQTTHYHEEETLKVVTPIINDAGQITGAVLVYLPLYQFEMPFYEPVGTVSIIIIMTMFVGFLAIQRWLTTESENLEKELPILFNRSDSADNANFIAPNYTAPGQIAYVNLQNSERRYRAFFENSNDAIVVTTTYGNIIDANPAYSILIGYTKEAMMHLDIQDTYTNPNDYLLFKEELEKHGFVENFEVKLRRRDGMQIDCSLSATVQREDEDNILGYQTIIRNITERKQAEQRLRESDARIRAIVETAAEGIMTVDENGIIEMANPAIEEMFSYQAHDMVGQNVTMLIPIPDQQPLEQFFRFYRQTREAGGLRSDGTMFPLEMTISEMHLGDKRIFTCLMHDITERKESEISLEAAHDELRQHIAELSMFNHIARSIATMPDLQSVLEIVNETMVHLFDAGNSGVALLNETGKELTVVDDYAHHTDILSTIGVRISLISPQSIPHKEDESVVGYTVIENLRTGVPTIIPNAQTNPLVDPVRQLLRTPQVSCLMIVPLRAQSQTIGIIFISTDQEKRQFTPDEVALAETIAGQIAGTIENTKLFDEVNREKQLFEAMMLNNPIATIIIDSIGTVDTWSPAAERLLGFSTEEAIGASIFDLAITEEARDEMINQIASLTHGNLTSGITQLERKDGELVDIESFAVPVTVDDEQVANLILYHDITQFKKTQKELRLAKESAEAANTAKSEFLANMSHEIRTPLNAIIGLTGLLLDTPLTDEQLDFVSTVRASGDALLTLINDILDFSKIEAGKLELEEYPFDIYTCVEESLDLIAPRLHGKSLELAYIIAPETPVAIFSDISRLRQVLVNLLSNAVKFTEKGEVVVSVDSKKIEDVDADEEMYKLHFAVRDTGIGIPEDRLAHLFKSFTQVDASTTRKYGGTGLGLAISKKLSELMGGEIWAESELDVGSTFHFTITAKSAPRQGKEILDFDNASLVDKHVLIVDDNTTNRQILTSQAKSWGMIPQTADSGLVALELLKAKENKFDLVISDMQMPEMDGLMLAQELRDIPTLCDLPLVMLTSLGFQIDKEATKKVRFSAFLTKPVKASALYENLISVFVKQQGRKKKSAEEPLLDANMGKRHPLHILVAEDNVVNQKVALRTLERLGYRADVAANGLEVLQSLDRQSYDVVLMDIQMPEMDGLTATRYIREKFPAESHPRIVAMTANALTGDRERYLEAGMDDYVSKPIRPNELIRALEESSPLIVSPRLSAPSHLRRGEVDDSTPDSAPSKDSGLLDIISSDENRDSPPIDLSSISGMLGGDAEMLADLISTFIDDTPHRLADMHQALNNTDPDQLYVAAHTLKSSSANFGALQMSEICKQIEAISKKNNWEESKKAVSALVAEYQLVDTALRAELFALEEGL